MKNNRNQIALEYNFDTHQKVHISVFSLLCLVILIAISLEINNLAGFFSTIMVIIVLIALISITFSKKGFVVIDKTLCKGIFVGKKLIFQRKIDLNNKPVFSVLKFKKIQKFAFFTVANPDLSHGFNGFDIYLLNENHTEKERIMCLKNELNSQKAIYWSQK